MAFVDPTQETPGPAVPAAQQAPVAAGGQGVGGASKAAATPGQNLPAQPSAQLSAYLTANQPQSQAFAGQIAGQVGSQVNAAGAAINPAVNAYTGNLYTVPTDAEVNKAVATSPSSLTTGQADTFKSELGAAAKAPNPAATFEASQGYADTASGIQKAVEQADLWNSGNDVASLSTALAPFEGANATAGDKTLDSLLLSQTPGAYKKIQSAVAPAADLSGQLTAGTASADAALQNAIAADLAATPAARSSAQTYAKTLSDYLAKSVSSNQSASNDLAAKNSTVQTDAAAGNLTADDAVALGIPADKAAAWAAAYNNTNATIAAENALSNNPIRAIGPTGLSPINLSSYLTPGTPGSEINLASVAKPQDYSDVAALQALLGSDNSIALPIDSSTLAQAGLGSNIGTAAKYDTASATPALTDLARAAYLEQQKLAQDAQLDPAQNPSQGNVLYQARTNINSLVAYLQALLGGVSPSPVPPNQGYRAINLEDPSSAPVDAITPTYNVPLPPPGQGYRAI